MPEQRGVRAGRSNARPAGAETLHTRTATSEHH